MTNPANDQNALNLYGLGYSDMTMLLASWGFSHYFADKLWKYLYIDRVESLEQMTSLRADLMSCLQQKTSLDRPSSIALHESGDGLTRKYLLRLSDGEHIECVIMEYDGRSTACISSQVGCAMGCVFCATGQMGLRRNLSSGEIVAQVVYLMRQLEMDSVKIRNVVFMGMGEPLHNYEATMNAIGILTNNKGLAIGPRYITVSTVGLPSGIRRLADEGQPVNLAVSLHAATEDERKRIVPISDRWPLSEVMESCREYVEKRRRRIFFEWALMAGINDSDRQAHALGRLLEGIESHVNLIPVNPTNGFDSAPSDNERARGFQTVLSRYGIPSTVRQKRGIDIYAGCGQLRTEFDGEANHTSESAA